MAETTDEPLLSPEFLAQLERLELVSRKIFQGRMKGERLSKRKGQSAEFADYRPYAIGDDLRFLDWNLYGRLDRLFLRLFMEEEDLHVYLLIDASRSMDYGSPTKLRYARQVAAALGFVGLTNLDRVVIESLTSGKPHQSPGYRGRKSMFRMLKFIDGVAPASTADLNEALRSFSLRCPGKGLVFLLSDFMDKGGYEEGLRYRIARNRDVVAVQVLAQEEVEPPMVGDLKLVDLEDDDEAEVTVSAPLLKRYRETLNAYRAELNQFCTRRGVTYLFTTNQVPFDKLVLGYLRQRGVVR